ncbi:MAG: transmembrane 220 family protein [Acidobacteriota bacterium]
MNQALKWANILMMVAFILSVVVQYNDPDPLRWILIYGLAGWLCIQKHRNKLRWYVAAAVAFVSLVWAVALAPSVVGQVRFAELFESIEMKSVRVEEAREMGGLLIIAAWMLVLILGEWVETSQHRESAENLRLDDR